MNADPDPQPSANLCTGALGGLLVMGIELQFQVIGGLVRACNKICKINYTYRQCCGSVESISFPWICLQIKNWLDPDPTKTLKTENKFNVFNLIQMIFFI